MPDTPIVAVVEAGGTSFKAVVAEVVGDSLIPREIHRCVVDSNDLEPAETLRRCADFFLQHKPATGYHALGIASFGPLGINPDLPTYGHILASSPKAKWRNIDLLTRLRNACTGSRPLAVAVDTDVNAPALSEYLLHDDLSRPISSTAYITVGTGIGVGLVIHGKTVVGMMHPEAGHVPVQPLPNDTFGGYSWGDKSPFHGQNTVEGLASSVALTERYQQMTGSKDVSRHVLASIGDDHEVFDHCANALANLCTTLILTTSVEKIVIGGGLSKCQGLIGKVQRRTLELINGYLELPPIEKVITLSQYEDAGLVGAMVMTRRAIDDGEKQKCGLDMVAMAHGVVLGAILGVLACRIMPKK